METLVQKVEDRKLFGRKVGSLRRNGITPANIFGHGIKSVAIQVETETVEKTLAQAGSTHMITLKSSTSKKGHKVLVKEVQRNPITGFLLHIDFHEIKMTDKVKVEIPLLFSSDAPAAQRKDVVLLENLRSIEIECLPDAIPESIPIDLSGLSEAGDHILVGDLQLDENIHILRHAEEIIARVEVARAAVSGGEAIAEVEGEQVGEAAQEEPAS